MNPVPRAEQRFSDPPPAAPLLAAALILDVAMLLTDLIAGSVSIPTSCYAIAPLIPMASGSVAATATAAGVSWAMIGFTTAWHDELIGAEAWIRLGVVGIIGTLAIAGAVYRGRLAKAIRHLAHLEEFSGMVEGRMTLTETADRLCELLVPRVGDIVTIDVSVKEGEVRRLAAASSGPAAAEEERRLRENLTLPRQAAPGVRAAMEWGDTILVERVGERRTNPQAARQSGAGANDPDGMPALASYLVVPLRSRGRILGALTLATTGRRRLTSQDLSFAQSLANRAAVALDNAGLWAELLAVERQLVEALDSLADAVTIHDRKGRPTYANEAAARFVGLTEPQQMVNAKAGDIRVRMDLRHEDGRPMAIDELPGRRVFETGRSASSIVLSTHPKTGRERWSRIRATPLHDSDGSIVAAVNIVEDLTAVKAGELRQRFLAEAAEVLGSSMDHVTALKAVAELAVPGIADWCAIDILDERGGVSEVARAGTGDPAPVQRAKDEGLAAVLASGESRALGSRDEGHSAIVTPMCVGPRPMGAVTLVDSEGHRSFGDHELALAQDLARRLANAVETSRLYEERGRIAKTLQAGLLPPALPSVPGFEVASIYRAAGDANEVGGDFYDVVPLGDDRWLAVIGDVAGKGARAATLTARARHTLMSVTTVTGNPAEAFTRLDEALVRDTDGGLVSAAIVVFSEGGITVTLAGHPSPLLVRGGVPERIGEPGPLLGLGQRDGWRECALEVVPDDAVVLYTDGVLDTVGAEDRFGEKRLMSAVAGKVADLGAQAVAAGVEKALADFQVGPQRDDVAVLVVQRERERDAATIIPRSAAL